MSAEELAKLQSHLPGLLAAAGAALQYARAHKAFLERYYAIAAVALAAAAYLLCYPLTASWRLYLVEMLDWMTLGGGVLAILGGTFVASSVAKQAVSKNPMAANNPMVPLTDSKG